SLGFAHRVAEEIHADSQRGLVKLRWIMVNLWVFPSIPQVRLVGIVYDKPVSQKNSEPLRREAVVLVDLGNAAREGIDKVVDRVRQRDFNERMVRKNARDFPPE